MYNSMNSIFFHHFDIGSNDKMIIGMDFSWNVFHLLPVFISNCYNSCFVHLHRSYQVVPTTRCQLLCFANLRLYPGSFLHSCVLLCGFRINVQSILYFSRLNKWVCVNTHNNLVLWEHFLQLINRLHHLSYLLCIFLLFWR